MKRNKPGNQKKISRVRTILACLLFILLLAKSNNNTVAQGDPYEYDEGYLNAYEESELYIDSYTRRKQLMDQEASYWGGSGYTGGVSTPNILGDTKPPQETTGPPTGPTYPDVPVNGYVFYLMAIGAVFFSYSIIKNKTA